MMIVIVKVKSGLMMIVVVIMMIVIVIVKVKSGHPISREAQAMFVCVHALSTNCHPNSIEKSC
jgi:hypothetical protein